MNTIHCATARIESPSKPRAIPSRTAGVRGPRFPFVMIVTYLLTWRTRPISKTNTYDLVGTQDRIQLILRGNQRDRAAKRKANRPIIQRVPASPPSAALDSLEKGEHAERNFGIVADCGRV